MFEKKAIEFEQGGGEKINKLARIGGLVLPLLLLATALSTPVALADSNSCTSCGSQDSCPTDENLTVKTENLEGFEELRAVTGAWTNEDTRLLMKELIWKDHCTPRLPNSEAQEVKVYRNNTLLSHSKVVKIPFRAHCKDVDAQITYRDNGASEKAYATVAGPASVLEEPMQILQENAKYQAIVENLEDQGYTVKEGSAQVVKSYTPADYASVPSCIEDEVWNTAIINVKVIKGGQLKNIAAFVCIDKSKVLWIEDPFGMSWCQISCEITCSGLIGAGEVACCAVFPPACGACTLLAFSSYGCGQFCSEHVC